MSKKILIVDDDESILGACEMTLLDAGYDVQTIEGNGIVVKQSVQKMKPHLILLDLFLSGSDGRSVVKELKSSNETKNVPVLLISSYPEIQKAAVEAGADGFLEKPFEVHQLMKTIDKYILK